jgi:transposase
MAVRYKVTLTPEEREQLVSLTKTGRRETRRILLGRALLLCDQSPEGLKWNTKDISEALGVSNRTVERAKKKFVENGLDQALERKPLDMSRRDIKFDGTFEARLIALACSEAPEGRARWTARLLAEKAVELNYTDSVSPMTVLKILKKTKLSLIKSDTGKFLRKEAARS